MKSRAIWISCILAALFCGRAANAKAIITFDQVGPNVVATSRGTVDLTGLTFSLHDFLPGIVDPNRGLLVLGGPGISLVDAYKYISGPGSFGEGDGALTSSSEGFGLIGVGLSSRELIVPHFYTGQFLSNTTIWDNTTLTGLGLRLGTSFTWTWGTGANADSLTLNIAPEPSTWSLLGIGFAALGAITYRRRKLSRI